MPVNCTRKSEKNPPVSSPITADETPHMVISRMSWPKPPFGRTLMLDEQAGARQKQAVAQIRKHEAEEEDIERGHQAVGIHPVVGGQGVHLRDGGQRLGDGVALKLDGHHRVVLRRRVGRLPAAGELPQLPQQLLLLGHGHPTRPGRRPSRESSRRLLASSRAISWTRRSQAQLQRRPPGGEAGHRGNGLLQCTGGLRLPRPPAVCRSRPPFRSSPAGPPGRSRTP